jgi:hypothetical protein
VSWFLDYGCAESYKFSKYVLKDEMWSEKGKCTFEWRDVFGDPCTSMLQPFSINSVNPTRRLQHQGHNVNVGFQRTLSMVGELFGKDPSQLVQLSWMTNLKILWSCCVMSGSSLAPTFPLKREGNAQVESVGNERSGVTQTISWLSIR